MFLVFLLFKSRLGLLSHLLLRYLNCFVEVSCEVMVDQEKSFEVVILFNELINAKLKGRLNQS